ncbi:MAG: hypothetical protein M4579_001619 [Chaenotheca gracillima]|nr:MAG: hypothetical protein M4579_001619 [Chaenotheca gracillima]
MTPVASTPLRLHFMHEIDKAISMWPEELASSLPEALRPLQSELHGGLRIWTVAPGVLRSSTTTAVIPHKHITGTLAQPEASLAQEKSLLSEKAPLYPAAPENKEGHLFLDAFNEKGPLLSDISEEKSAPLADGVEEDIPTLHAKTREALARATTYAFDTARDDGHWCAELLSNCTLTSEHVFFRQSLGLDLTADGDDYRRYLLSEQQADGSWTIAPGHPGDISTSSEAYLALKILGMPADAPEMRRARDFILSIGGVAKVRIFTRIYFAQFGLFPWEAVPQLPAEFILVPSQSPINVYKLSSWARSTTIPLLIIRHHEPIYALPNGTSPDNHFLDEIWLNPADKMVPYGSGLADAWKNDIVEFVFGAIDKVLYALGGLRWSPVRSYARQQCVNWILSRQEKAGDWAGIIPPMHAGVQALLLEGFTLEDEPVRNGLEAIRRFGWEDERGKRMQACVSPVWDTTLMVRALVDGHAVDRSDERLHRAVQWSMARQCVGPEGDWRIYNPDLAPGGFAFEYYNTWYPDVDGTAAAVLAFVTQDPALVYSPCVARAANWMVGMQNSDGGWAAFDHENNKLFLNKIPFSDMNSLCDPSTADVTARILEAFGLMIQSARPEKLAPGLLKRISAACDRGISFLAREQEQSGAWYGRWGVNYLYGTSHVLCGLEYFHDDHRVQGMVPRATQWFKQAQNADGGWGEGLDTYPNPSLQSAVGPSTASQTAWALMALLTTSRRPWTDPSIKRGMDYLCATQTDVLGEGASWPEPLYTGTGFPGYFYCGYTLYRHYFPMMALGRYASAMEASAAV